MIDISTGTIMAIRLAEQNLKLRLDDIDKKLEKLLNELTKE